MTKEKRAWQVWPSKNHFRCNGRLITGPDKRSFIIATLATVLPSLVFYGQVCPWLIMHTSFGIPVTIISVLMLVFTLITLFICAYMDPGIIPLGVPRPNDDNNPFSKRTPPQFQKITVKGVKIRVKYCDTCAIYRPPRSTHCSICDNCVDRFDHHCPWIGNCIGKRNYRFFLFFVFLVLVNCIYACAFSVVEFTLNCLDSDRDGVYKFVDGLKRSPLTIPLALYSLIIFGLVSSLAGFHTYLVMTGQTTNENLKRSWKEKPNPHTLGPCGNIFFLFCPPFFPSYIRPRQPVHEDGEILHEKGHRDLKMEPSASSIHNV